MSVSQAVRLAWLADPRDTAITISLSLISGVFTAFGLLATTGVLSALFAAQRAADKGSVSA